jgi:hypothetical protein
VEVRSNPFVRTRTDYIDNLSQLPSCRNSNSSASGAGLICLGSPSPQEKAAAVLQARLCENQTLAVELRAGAIARLPPALKRLM